MTGVGEERRSIYKFKFAKYEPKFKTLIFPAIPRFGYFRAGVRKFRYLFVRNILERKLIVREQFYIYFIFFKAN